VINFLVLLKDSRTRRGKTFTPGAINSYLRNIKTGFNWAMSEKSIRKKEKNRTRQASAAFSRELA
jgi:hypothetical protein